MLKNTCIIPIENSYPTDIGLIAENLLFYDTVHLIASTDTVPSLLKHCDLTQIKELVQNGQLKLYFKENHLGAMKINTPNGTEINDVAIISSPDHDLEYYVNRSLFLATKRKGYSRRMAKNFLDIVEPIKYEDGLADIIRTDLDESSYVKKSIIETIKFYNPEFSISIDEFKYKKIPVKNGFIFETDLNLEEINSSISTKLTDKVIVNSTFILNLQETRGDLHLASYLNSDLVTSSLHSNLIKLKFDSIYEKSTKRIDEIQQFSDVILGNGHAIKESINSGEKSFNDFLKILKKANKFKNWKSDLTEDSSLLKEYYASTTKDTWIDKLPGKGFRWSIFTGLGLAADLVATGGLGTVLGLTLSAGDAFLFDKAVKGWKPNTFIDKDLKKYLK